MVVTQVGNMVVAQVRNMVVLQGGEHGCCGRRDMVKGSMVLV